MSQDFIFAFLAYLSSYHCYHHLHRYKCMLCECFCSEKEIDILENELGIKSKPKAAGEGMDGSKKKDPNPTQQLSPLKEPTMISIPLLPMPYQPGGEPGKGHINYLDSVDAMLETEFSPPDRYFTVSALLGRLRDPMKLPYPPNRRMLAMTNTKGKKAETPEQEEKRKRLALEKQEALLALDKVEVYHREQADTTGLLALYKKISSHRTAAVFRKPVNPAEGEWFVWNLRSDNHAQSITH